MHKHAAFKQPFVEAFMKHVTAMLRKDRQIPGQEDQTRQEQVDADGHAKSKLDRNR